MDVTAKDFGWHTDEPAYSCAYLSPVVKKLLAKLGCSSVLDIGCGNGVLCRELEALGYDVVGCDVDQVGVDIARSSSSSIPFHCLGVYDDPNSLGRSGFDVAISTEVVEHLYLPAYLPRFANALLKPGGYLIISTPYHGYLKNLAMAILDKWDHHHDPHEDGGHIKFWSRKTLTELLEKNGFEVTEFCGAGRAPFLWKSMVLLAKKVEDCP